MKRLFGLHNRVFGETCMFAGCDWARLRFPCRTLCSVRDASGCESYVQGRDYTLEKDGIHRVEGGRIPWLTDHELRPEAGTLVQFPAVGCQAIGPGTDGRDIRFQEGLWYHERQFNVDYVAESKPEIPVAHARNDFSHDVSVKLKRGHDFRLTFIGDSITTGCNCTGKFHSHPHQPGYPELVAQELEEVTGCRADCRNHAVGGTGCKHALEEIRETWIHDRPDLLVIAYGMNDFHNLQASEFIRVLKDIMEAAARERPDTLFMAVASMAGNPSWLHTPPVQAQAYKEALLDFAGSRANLGVADVHGAWEGYEKLKGFYALTGNGVNHPNDFGHRLYASVLLNELLPQEHYLG